MNDVRNRYILLALVVGATCLVMYLIGIFYQKFLNSPYDLIALIFIVVFYAATLYFHLQRPGSES
jgi:biotin transporter BioY